MAAAEVVRREAVEHVQTQATIEAFAQVEGLDAHGRAASIRFE